MGISHNTFIIRIWWQAPPPSAQTPAWRGHVEHIPGGETLYFRDLPTLQRFLERFTGPLEVASPRPGAQQ